MDSDHPCIKHGKAQDDLIGLREEKIYIFLQESWLYTIQIHRDVNRKFLFIQFWNLPNDITQFDTFGSSPVRKDLQIMVDLHGAMMIHQWNWVSNILVCPNIRYPFEFDGLSSSFLLKWPFGVIQNF